MFHVVVFRFAVGTIFPPRKVMERSIAVVLRRVVDLEKANKIKSNKSATYPAVLRAVQSP